jgi:hypothetical protein
VPRVAVQRRVLRPVRRERRLVARPSRHSLRCVYPSSRTLCLAAFAPGLGSPLPHLLRNRARPSHTCTRTGLTPATSAPGLGSPQPYLHRDWAHPSHIYHRDRCRRYTGPFPRVTPAERIGDDLYRTAVPLRSESCADVAAGWGGARSPAVTNRRTSVRACLVALVCGECAPARCGTNATGRRASRGQTWTLSLLVGGRDQRAGGDAKDRRRGGEARSEGNRGESPTPGADATGVGAQFQCAQAFMKRLDECHKGGSGGPLGAVLRDALGSAWSAPN